MNNIYGYIRVSTISQREDRQWAALEGFGIPHENVFIQDEPRHSPSIGCASIILQSPYQISHQCLIR